MKAVVSMSSQGAVITLTPEDDNDRHTILELTACVKAGDFRFHAREFEYMQPDAMYYVQKMSARSD